MGNETRPLIAGVTAFFTGVGSDETRRCGVCGAECGVRRGVTGPTSTVEAMGGGVHLHDAHTCPHVGTTWHNRAEDLFQAAAVLPPGRVRSLMERDLRETLGSQGSSADRMHPVDPGCSGVVPAGATSYLLHEMREVELAVEAILDLLRRQTGLEASEGEPAALLELVVRALRELDARLFVPAEPGPR